MTDKPRAFTRLMLERRPPKQWRQRREQRLHQLVTEKFGSMDRFYLETGFSKGHLSHIIRGERSPSLANP